MVDFRARRAGFVSTAGFTDDAVRFSLRNKMELIDKRALTLTIERFHGWNTFHEALDYFSKRCPKCGGKAETSSTLKSVRKYKCLSSECDYTWQKTRTD